MSTHFTFLACAIIVASVLSHSVAAFSADLPKFLPGSVAWNMSFPSAGDPVFCNGLVLVRRDCSNYPCTHPNLYAIDGDTGVLVWNLTLSVTYQLHCGPTLVYMMGQSHVHAWGQTSGKEVWNWTSPASLQSLPQAITYAEGHVFVTSNNGYVFKLSATTGLPLWSKLVAEDQQSFLVSTLVVSGGVGYVPGNNDGILYAFNTMTGLQVWNASITQIQYVTLSQDGATLICTCSGAVQLFAIRTKDGTPVWNSTNINGYNSCLRTITSNDGLAYVSSSGTIYCFDIGTGKQMGNFPAANNAPTFLHIDGPILYTSDALSIIALDRFTLKAIWSTCFNPDIVSVTSGIPAFGTNVIANRTTCFAFGQDQYQNNLMYNIYML